MKPSGDSPLLSLRLSGSPVLLCGIFTAASIILPVSYILCIASNSIYVYRRLAVGLRASWIPAVTEKNNISVSYSVFEVLIMSAQKCNFCSDEKCVAADLVPCDFEGDNFKECLRYRLYFIRPQSMQLR